MKTKTSSPDIWLQEHEASGHFDTCSCRVVAEYRELGDNGSPAFFMCPKHNAADYLLAALRPLIKAHRKGYYPSNENWKAVRAAIKKAERKDRS